MFKHLFGRKKSPAEPLYGAIVAAARRPLPYAEWGVPDTVNGRFDMIVLHLFMVLQRVKGADEAFAQQLVDEFFRDMDRSLREMGVADLGVGKKVRKMAEACYGRLAAYQKAVEEGEAALTAAIARNLFPDGGSDPGAARLAAYVRTELPRLQAMDVAELVAGRPAFAEYAA